MEFVLRCNDLKCRAQLHDQAVVTTCSHVFCSQCADRTRLSQAPNANRICPACDSTLPNADDVVCAGLNPTEDYKTSLLSGLSPTVIMECATRGLGFYSYQASQEVVYQEHLAKSLKEKYDTLNTQMDQLIHEANSQIKMLTDRMTAMQAEQVEMEEKNHELLHAFREKSKAQQQLQRLYQSLKAQVMASQVANAADDQVEHELHQHTVRPDRLVDRLPGTRTGTAQYSQRSAPLSQQAGRQEYQNRRNSGSSSGTGRQGGGVGLNTQRPKAYPNARGYAGPAAGTPAQAQAQPRSRLPVLGGTRPNPYMNSDAGAGYQESTRGAPGVNRQTGAGFGIGTKGTKRRVN